MTFKNHYPQRKKAVKRLLLMLGILILILFLREEYQPYEILHSTVMSSSNLTENKLTVVVHSLFPIDEETLAEDIVSRHQYLNGERPNSYYQLELYRTSFHYRLQIPYDTILCDETGRIITEITF